MRVTAQNPLAVTVELSPAELGILKNALNEVCHGPDAIEDWEFDMRMGVQPDEAKELLKQLGKAHGSGGIV